MDKYSRIDQRVVQIDLRGEHPWDEIIGELAAIWMDDYRAVSPNGLVLEVPAAGFWYVFDVTQERLIAAFGFTRPQTVPPRDKGRMKKHPLSTGPLYHRGHAIAHTMGGPTDINIVPQLGSVNIGAFRILEKKAVATPGALYFSHWRYGPGCSQLPIAVEQGLLIAGHVPEIVSHPNMSAYTKGKKRPDHVEAFICLVLADARNVKRRWRIPVSVVIAQSAQETGWGRSVKGNAYFGVKAARESTSVVKFKTTEVAAGGRTSIQGSFRSYTGFADAADDYGRFLSENSRYAKAFQFTNDPLRFAEEIAKAGYATDPQYGTQLKAIITSQGLDEFDE